MKFESKLLIYSVLITCFAGCGHKKQIGEDSSLEPSYHASYADGITFNKPGYPDFVSSVEGFSGMESFGRWTVGDEAKIEFKSELPKKFTLKISATTFDSCLNGALDLIFDDKTYKMEFPKIWEFKEFSVVLENTGHAKEIAFHMPNAKSPKALGISGEEREVCLALSTIKIVE